MTATDNNFDTPWVLIGEGWGDVRFFEKLFVEHTIGQDFTVKTPAMGNSGGGGREAIGPYLSEISTNERFIQKVKAVLIVSDNDSNPDASFKAVQDQISKVPEWPIPKNVGEVARAKEQPSIVVFMLPVGKHGNLETLCLESAYERWPLRSELEDFVAKTPAKDWEIGKQDKMKIQTLLSANNNKQPDAGFASSWNQKEKYQIPVTHTCFDEIVGFIRDFQKLLDA